MRRALLAVIAVALALPNAGVGQDVRADDVSSIDGLMKAYYEVVSGPAGGMSDVTRDRTLHHPEAWVAIAGVDLDGAPIVNVMTLDGYHGENSPRADPFWEYETDRLVHRSGNMATIWSSYASSRTPDGEPFTEGVNTLTLWWDGDRWWIMNWMFDTSAG
jgi:hypothetical protein